MEKIVLFMDNKSSYLDIQSRLLEKEGYRVIKAPTLQDAEDILKKKRIHVAVLDIRMEDEEDEQDISGLLFAQKEEYHSLPKIILTAYPSFEYVREVLGPPQKGLPSAVNFLGKDEGFEALIQALNQAFATHVGINWDLNVKWRGRKYLSFPYFVTLIEPETNRFSLPDKVGEVEDLFRKLFRDFDQIILSRLFWVLEDRFAVEVFAYSKTKEEQFVVVCGSIWNSKTEQKFFEDITQKIQLAGKMTKVSIAVTLHYAAILWKITNVNLESVNTFGRFYRENNNRMIQSALKHLFQITLAPWYEERLLEDEKKSLGQIFRERFGFIDEVFPIAKFESKIRALSREALSKQLAKIIYSPSKLTFKFPGGQVRSYPNPIPYLYNENMFPDYRVVYGVTLGRLDVDTILVANDSHTMLTDFMQSGSSPIIEDFILLETSIRFNLIDVENLLILEDFEKQFLDSDSLSKNIRQGNVEPECRKALVAIQNIRQFAGKMAGNDPNSYYIGLLFFVANHLSEYDTALKSTKNQIASLLHSLLLASMLCDKIAQIKNTPHESAIPQEAAELQIDESKHEVLIGEEEFDLTITEFNLLIYLYHHAGKLCKRPDIVREVFGYKKATPDEEKNLLNTPIYRLRQKIETDPSNPIYIKTVHGQGYKLIIQPK